MSAIGSSDSSARQIQELQKKVAVLESQVQKKQITDNAVVIPQKSDEISQSKIQKGIIPTGKGFLAGAAVGAITQGSFSYIASVKNLGVFGDIMPKGALISGAFWGGMIGGVTGAIVSNVTDNKWKAAAVSGVVAGMGTGVIGMGWMSGLISGAASGALSASMVHRK